MCIQENKKKRIYYINTLDSFTEWEEKTQGDISKSGMGSKREVFRSFGYFQGKPHIIDEKLFHTDTGIYEGTPHDALVWPDADSDERWRKQLTFHLKVNNAEVTIGFIARGPKIAFCGHSFTGLWDSAYYYFRELAKMGGAGMPDWLTATGAEQDSDIMLDLWKAVKKERSSAKSS